MNLKLFRKMILIGGIFLLSVLLFGHTAYAEDEAIEDSICQGDFDCDGDVDGTDLDVFASEYGRTDCAPVQQVLYPVTVAMDDTLIPQHTFTGNLVNDRQISGPVAPGANVQVSFAWNRTEVPGCPNCIIQHYVGFAGGPGFCVDSGFAGESGTANVTLTAPNTPGSHVIAGIRTLQLTCVNVTIPANPSSSSYVGVATVK